MIHTTNLGEQLRLTLDLLSISQSWKKQGFSAYSTIWMGGNREEGDKIVADFACSKGKQGEIFAPKFVISR